MQWHPVPQTGCPLRGKRARGGSQPDAQNSARCSNGCQVPEIRKEDAQQRCQLRTHSNPMDDIHFERHFRTPHSEGYYIMQGTSLQSNSRLGTVDIHFTTTTVHGTLILERELAEADLTKLIEQIDEDLVLSADMPRDDFLVSVYVGKDVGFYSDEYFAEESDSSADFGEDEEI